MGVITNAGPAHLAGFGGSVRGVAQAKGELFAGLQPGVLQCAPSGLDAEFRCALARPRDAALLDARAGDDPLVGGIDELLQLATIEEDAAALAAVPSSWQVEVLDCDFAATGFITISLQ